MTPHDAQRAMHALEQHHQDWTGEQFLAWLLGVPDPEPAGAVVMQEAERAFGLAEDHYQRVTQRVAVLNPRMIAQVGFVQGATFAAAALGRQPFPADVEAR
jgi:hypothetical protein